MRELKIIQKYNRISVIISLNLKFKQPEIEETLIKVKTSWSFSTNLEKKSLVSYTAQEYLHVFKLP